MEGSIIQRESIITERSIIQRKSIITESSLTTQTSIIMETRSGKASNSPRDRIDDVDSKKIFE